MVIDWAGEGPPFPEWDDYPNTRSGFIAIEGDVADYIRDNWFTKRKHLPLSIRLIELGNAIERARAQTQAQAFNGPIPGTKGKRRKH